MFSKVEVSNVSKLTKVSNVTSKISTTWDYFVIKTDFYKHGRTSHFDSDCKNNLKSAFGFVLFNGLTNAFCFVQNGSQLSVLEMCPPGVQQHLHPYHDSCALMSLTHCFLHTHTHTRIHTEINTVQQTTQACTRSYRKQSHTCEYTHILLCAY